MDYLSPNFKKASSRSLDSVDSKSMEKISPYYEIPLLSKSTVRNVASNQLRFLYATDSKT